MSRVKLRFEEKAIDAIFHNLDQCHQPGAAVGIAVGGVPVYRKGFGLASVNAQVTLSPSTRMRIYSITKHFTCFAYLLLCRQGRAQIDDTIEKYLPELRGVTHRVTMRQLMAHTSGLRDACDIRWFFSGIERTVSAPHLLALYRDIEDVNFAPDEAWCYNNGAYHILSSVIEKIADSTLEDAFRRLIFEPIGMCDTTLERTDVRYVPNSASMHTLRTAGYEKKFLPGELAGEGGIVSSVDDMLRWMTSAAGPDARRAELWDVMSASSKLKNGAETGYGLGLARRSYRGVAVISHSGGGLGSNSQMIRVPNMELDIIVLVNRSDASSTELAGRILDMCIGTEPGFECPEFTPVSGLFRSSRTGRFAHLYAREGRQMAALDGEEGVQVALRADRELGLPPYYFWTYAIKWHGDPPDRIRYECYGFSDDFEALPAGAPSGAAGIIGDYLAESVGVRLSITQDEQGDHATTTGEFGSRVYKLEGLGPNIWRIKAKDGTGWSATITASGSVLLTLTTSTTWQIPFRRAV